VDAERLFEEPAVERHAVHRVGEAEARARQLRGEVRVPEQPVAQASALALPPLGLVAVDEPREVELELVAVARRVRALDLAQLALEAEVHDAVRLRRVEPLRVAVVLPVYLFVERREGVAVLEAHATSVADLEDARRLLAQRARVPVDRLGRVVREPVGGLVRDPAGLARRAAGPLGRVHRERFDRG
jgi:hypothetical protein